MFSHKWFILCQSKYDVKQGSILGMYTTLNFLNFSESVYCIWNLLEVSFCTYKDLDMEVMGLDSPISKKKINLIFYLSHFKEHRTGERTSCTEMFTQVNWIIKLFVYVLLALGDPVNTELSLEAGRDAGYRGRPVSDQKSLS